MLKIKVEKSIKILVSTQKSRTKPFSNDLFLKRGKNITDLGIIYTFNDSAFGCIMRAYQIQ